MEFSDAVDRLHGVLQEVFLKKANVASNKPAWASSAVIPWSWVAAALARLLSEYSTGLTDATALSELELQWEQAFFKHSKGFGAAYGTIQSMYDYQRTAALEVVTKDWQLFSLADIWLVTVSDGMSYKVMDMYMHPKFNQWIASSRPSLRSGIPFLKDRTMRMFCGAKINSPISSQYDNKDVSRITRVARVPPTQLLMFVLTPNDGNFIRGEFTDSLRNVIQPGILGRLNKHLHKLWLKVIHVEKTEHISANQNVNQDLITEDDGENTKLRRTDIFVVDMTPDNEPAVLSLYDQQTQLATMLTRGDYIGLYNPGFPTARTESQRSHSDIVFEYTEDTVIFHMAEKDARQAGVNKVEADTANSQMSHQSRRRDSIHNSLLSNSSQKQQKQTTKKGIMERDEEGFMDCLAYPNRIFIKDLEPSMLNITLLCRVVAIASNNPFTKQDSKTKMDRYAMRIVDSTGKVDVTLWEQAGRKARKLQPGQYVLLTGLTTSSSNVSDRGTSWFVNGSAVTGTEIYNISTMKGLLASSCLRQIKSIQNVESNQGSWQVNITVVGWRIRTEDDTMVIGDCYEQDPDEYARADGRLPADIITIHAHTACFHPVYRSCEARNTNGGMSMRICEFCKCLIPEEQVVEAFRNRSSIVTTADSPGTSSNRGWVEWTLDDCEGQMITAFGCEEALLGVSAQQFKLMSYDGQTGLLDSVLGKPLLCSISTTSQGYRIDQVALSQPTYHDCMELLRNYS
ncbi:hypothetical protein BDB00DRAFT_798833 [Zychaea mexicana]|uniref:uncharacterized protein n=1 Tax=Zychaea mexicana TaxID=64656 RepID=UPI0022FE523D|nr:uncharacterized protein BDB00DRAFT_798833 [Zychaea mexicana]KAI9498636.1 hypothetical protein BDB00DRAFT_798833 [Zychaea mexicana]